MSRWLSPNSSDWSVERSCSVSVSPWGWRRKTVVSQYIFSLPAIQTIIARLFKANDGYPSFSTISPTTQCCSLLLHYIMNNDYSLEVFALWLQTSWSAACVRALVCQLNCWFKFNTIIHFRPKTTFKSDFFFFFFFTYLLSFSVILPTCGSISSRMQWTVALHPLLLNFRHWVCRDQGSKKYFLNYFSKETGTFTNNNPQSFWTLSLRTSLYQTNYTKGRAVHNNICGLLWVTVPLYKRYCCWIEIFGALNDSNQMP